MSKKQSNIRPLDIFKPTPPLAPPSKKYGPPSPPPTPISRQEANKRYKTQKECSNKTLDNMSVIKSVDILKWHKHKVPFPGLPNRTFRCLPFIGAFETKASIQRRKDYKNYIKGFKDGFDAGSKMM